MNWLTRMANRIPCRIGWHEWAIGWTYLECRHCKKRWQV